MQAGQDQTEVASRVSRSPSNLWMAYLCLALSMALVGSYVALSKPLVVVMGVFLLAWLRFGIGSLAMLFWLKKPAHEPTLTRRTHGLLFLQSFLGNFMFSIAMLFGVGMTSVVSAGVIMATIPAVIAVLSWIILKERVEPKIWGAVVCGAAGIALLSMTRGWQVVLPLRNLPFQTDIDPAVLGNSLVFTAVLCEAAYAVIGKKLTNTLSPKRIAALLNLWGLVLMTPMGLYAALGFDFSQITPQLWLLLVLYALAASVWTVWLWMTGLRTIPAARAGIFTVMLPISAALTGVYALNEPMSSLQLIAFSIALIGLVLATLSSKKVTQAIH